MDVEKCALTRDTLGRQTQDSTGAEHPLVAAARPLLTWYDLHSVSVCLPRSHPNCRGRVQSAHALQPEPPVVLRLRLLACGTCLPTCAAAYLCHPIGRCCSWWPISVLKGLPPWLPTTTADHFSGPHIFFPRMCHDQGVYVCMRVCASVTKNTSMCRHIQTPCVGRPPETNYVRGDSSTSGFPPSLGGWMQPLFGRPCATVVRACCPTQNAPAHEAAVTPQSSWHTPVLCHRVTVCGSGHASA